MSILDDVFLFIHVCCVERFNAISEDKVSVNRLKRVNKSQTKAPVTPEEGYNPNVALVNERSLPYTGKT